MTTVPLVINGTPVPSAETYPWFAQILLEGE